MYNFRKNYDKTVHETDELFKNKPKPNNVELNHKSMYFLSHLKRPSKVYEKKGIYFKQSSYLL